MIFLERTIGEFEKLDVDVSSAQKELRKVKNQYKNLVEKYQQTLLYYRKLVARGASLIERVDILKRIMKKYSKHHIDLSEAELELKKLYEEQQ